MNNGFVKLYGTILTSSVWVESTSTRIVWITLLALADKDGVVAASLPGLAHMANVSVPECEAAMRVLCAPDAHSRTKDHDGRRVEEVDGGWIVLNRQKYRDLRTPGQIDAAERQQRHRDASRMSRTEKETEKEIKTKNIRRVHVYPPDFELFWNRYPTREGSVSKRETFQAWNARQAEGHDVQEMYDGEMRYDTYVKHRAWIATRFVMQPQTFVGPDCHFKNMWEIAPDQKGVIPMSKSERDAEHFRKRGYIA